MGSHDRTSPGPGHVHPAGRRSPPGQERLRGDGQRPSTCRSRPTATSPGWIIEAPHFPGWDSFGAFRQPHALHPRPREARQEDRGGHRLAPRRRRRAPDLTLRLGQIRHFPAGEVDQARLGSPRPRKAKGAARFRAGVPAVGDQHRAGDERRRLMREEQHTRGDLVGVPLRPIGPAAAAAASNGS